MVRQDTWIKVGEVLRYPARKDPAAKTVDGFPNFFHVTHAPGFSKVQLERGINAPAAVAGPEGPRRSVLLIRSSPWKAGTEQTPWHDVFDMDNGHVRYFGDHKMATSLQVGSTPGNRELLQAWELHQAPAAHDRIRAAPLLLFRAVRRNNRPKGHVEFCGVGLVERAERVVQWTGKSRQTFVNYVYDIALLDLAAEGDCINWEWVSARREPGITLEETLAYAPEAWRRWIEDGPSSLSRLRRRVARASVHKIRDQRPAAESAEKHDLDVIYRRFDGRKHEFECLAAAVAAKVIRGRGATYREGWLTRPAQDGGTDFVGRLDVGTGTAVAKLVVLGQAKCVAPTSTISADQVARVVARLQRGWIGVYVTTGAFSESAQMEIIEDRYPIILVNGTTLAEQVRQLANEAHGGNLTSCIDKITSFATHEIFHRRPEEILLE